MYPASKKFKHPNHDGVVGIQKNCADEHDSLLCLFIEYVWNDKVGQYLGCRGIELINWLKSKNVNHTDWHWFCTNIQYFPMNLNSSNVRETAQEAQNNRFRAQLAYELRAILPFLINSNNNFKYKNADGKTLLHSFIDKHLKNQHHFSQDQIFKLRKLLKSLAESAALFCANDKDGKTPIHLASFCENPEILKAIISSLINVEERDQHGNTPLHILVDNCVNSEEDDHEKGFMDLARMLIMKGANVNVKNHKGITPVHLVAEKFHDGMLKFFANCGADLTQKADDDKNCLHFACRSSTVLDNVGRMLETIDTLVFRGCAIQATDKNGCMPLHYAAAFSSIDVVNRLIGFGASVDCQTRETLLTPLYFAAIGDRLDVMQLLIKFGADVNAKTLDNSSALFMSVLWGSYKSMKYLINVGADIYRRDSIAGFTLLHLTAEMTDDDADKEINLRKIYDFIDKGFDINDPGMCGITPIQLATGRDNLDNVKILTERGAYVDYQSEKSSITALHLAVIRNNFDIAKILVDNGADVNRIGGVERMTPLHYVLAPEIRWELGKYPAEMETYFDASYMKKFWPPVETNLEPTYDRLIPMLLSKGAKVNMKDSFGRTPLHLVALRQIHDAMKMILEAGARVNVQDKDGILPIHSVLKNNNVDGLKLLLEFGANFNDDDTCKMISNNLKARATLMEHIIKLKIIGMPINVLYKDLIDMHTITIFNKQCLMEAQVLKRHHDTADGFSVHEFLQMNAKRQYLFIEKIKSYGENLDKVFPIYTSLIRAACRESENRKFLVEEARVAWNKVFDIYLPDLCLDNIFSYLSNRYLELFVDGANDEESIVIQDRRKSLIVGSCKRAN